MTDLTDDREPSKTELAFELVRSRMLTLLLIVVLAAVGFLLLAIFFAIPSPPRWSIILGFALVSIAPYGYLFGTYFMEWLIPSREVYLVDVDAREEGGALWKMPPEGIHRLDVEDGELHRAAPELYFGKRLDPDAGTVIGTWRGTYSDRELLAAYSNVEEVRGQLEEDARRGWAIQTNAWAIIRGATQDCVTAVIETFEAGTLPDDGASLGERIEDALEEHDLRRRVGDPEDVGGEYADDDGDATENDPLISELSVPDPFGSSTEGEADD